MNELQTVQLTRLVQGLSTDIHEALAPWRHHTNIFDILGETRAELKHSNFLAWLLQPGNLPGVGDGMIRQLLRQLQQAGETLPLTALELLLGDLSDLTVSREYQHIDLLLRSAKLRLTLIIENKIDTGQHNDQLARYMAIAKREGGDDQRYIGLYLTKTGDDPQNADYCALSYAQVYAAATAILPQVTDTKTKAYLSDYLDIVRSDIMADEQLTATIKAIIQRYGEELALIAPYLTSGEDDLRQAIWTALDEAVAAGQLSYLQPGTAGNIRFRTAAMDAYFADVADVSPAANSWTNNAPYFFEIIFGVKNIYCKLALHQNEHVTGPFADKLTTLLAYNGKGPLETGKKFRNLGTSGHLTLQYKNRSGELLTLTADDDPDTVDVPSAIARLVDQANHLPVLPD